MFHTQQHRFVFIKGDFKVYVALYVEWTARERGQSLY